VSHTTRQPRPKEEDGVDYHFVSHETIRKKIDRGDFLEHASVHNNTYGTSAAAILRVHEADKVCVLDVDVQGVEMVKANSIRAVAAVKYVPQDKRRSALVISPHCVFIAPPSISELERRLRGRGTETEESLRVRLGNAQKELTAGQTPGNFDHVLVNDDLESAWQELDGIVRHAFPSYFVTDPSTSKPLPETTPTSTKGDVEGRVVETAVKDDGGGQVHVEQDAEVQSVCVCCAVQ
jgi:guanylate kinase